MSYRVLIPTAGTGSRLGNATKYLNKSLVGIADRPTLSHVIEQFPKDAEFVLALGHKGALVKEFLQLAYPDRKFFFNDVFPFEGPGSGLGLSIMTCREYLRQPFIFISCDTLVRGNIPAPDHNWMGYAELSDLTPYRTLEIQSDEIHDICEKGVGQVGSHQPYIGLAGIHDHETFWRAMETGSKEAITVGEAHGMRALLMKQVKAHGFTWFDTGNPESLARTREAFRQPNSPNILEKATEAIWFIGESVVKFSDDLKFIANRVARSKEIEEFIPKLKGSTSHMYSYEKVEGEILSKVVNLPLFERLLQHSRTFWQPKNLCEVQAQEFRSICMKIYKKKTEERVDLFYKNFDKHDEITVINGVAIPGLEQMLESLDWNWISDGLPGRFHGDFHFENILYTPSTEKFTFLDWRQEFGGSLTTGDIYYDLAKLLHGLIICHELILQDHYQVVWKEGNITFDFHRKQVLVECERFFTEWVCQNGYDPKKVWVLTALVYLNIAALHHYPYSLLLFALGKKMLFDFYRERI
jgi:dTDP-glucose pyrophosphorylase